MGEKKNTLTKHNKMRHAQGRQTRVVDDSDYFQLIKKG